MCSSVDLHPTIDVWFVVEQIYSGYEKLFSRLKNAKTGFQRKTLNVLIFFTFSFGL